MFAERFANWDITLPAENIRQRTTGHIEKKGWLIQYCFGHDENGEYLDYYASHRMTDDEHIRLCADGSQIELAALGGHYLTSTDLIEAMRCHYRSHVKPFCLLQDMLDGWMKRFRHDEQDERFFHQ